MSATGIAIVGCGYVADFYLATLEAYPCLELRGVYDLRAERGQALHDTYGVPRVYPSMADLLDDRGVEIVVNLTNPAAHAAITRAALEAGRHVYSEKPLALELAAARALVELAERRGLLLASAPSSLLGATAQTLWAALDDARIGRPLLAYAELDDGALRRMPYAKWVSPSGAPWPHEDEFAIGGTIEHAAYYLTWLTAFFGPARELAAISARGGDWGSDDGSPHDCPGDFGAALIRFETGTIARLTCSTLAPRNHSLRIIGDEGVLTVGDCWDYWSDVTLRPARRDEARHRLHDLDDPVRLALPRPPASTHPYVDTHRMDFASGIAELAGAARGHGSPLVGPRHALHVLELTLAIAGAADATVVAPTTSFPPPRRGMVRARTPRPPGA